MLGSMLNVQIRCRAMFWCMYYIHFMDTCLILLESSPYVQICSTYWAQVQLFQHNFDTFSSRIKFNLWEIACFHQAASCKNALPWYYLAHMVNFGLDVQPRQKKKNWFILKDHFTINNHLQLDSTCRVTNIIHDRLWLAVKLWPIPKTTLRSLPTW